MSSYIQDTIMLHQAYNTEQKMKASQTHFKMAVDYSLPKKCSGDSTNLGKKVLWLDETYIFGTTSYSHDPENNIPTMKYSDGSITLW